MKRSKVTTGPSPFLKYVLLVFLETFLDDINEIQLFGSRSYLRKWKSSLFLGLLIPFRFFPKERFP